MKANNPKTTSPDLQMDRILMAIDRLSLVALIRMDSAVIRNISNPGSLQNAQASGQQIISSSMSAEQNSISSSRAWQHDSSLPRSAEQDNLIDPLYPVRGVSLSAQSPEDLRLSWTHSKIGLVELIYALKELGVFNHGKAELKTITRCFEYMFSFELGNISSSFQEIVERKKSPTNIIDKLRDTFLKKVERSGR